MRVGVRFNSMVQQSQCHLMMTKSDVVIGNLDENICSAMVTITQCRLVMEEAPTVILEGFILMTLTAFDIPQCVKESPGSITHN